MRGRRAVIIVYAEEYDRLATPAPPLALIDFLESLDTDGLDLTRERDPGRDDSQHERRVRNGGCCLQSSNG